MLQEISQYFLELRPSTNWNHFDLTFEWDHHVSIRFHLLLAVENHKQQHNFDY